MKTIQNLIILLGHMVLFIPKRQIFLISNPLGILDQHLKSSKFDESEKKIDAQTILPINHKENNFSKNNFTLIVLLFSITYMYFNFHKLKFKKKVVFIVICLTLLISWVFRPIPFLSEIFAWIIKGSFYLLKSFFSSFLFFGY